MKGAGASKMSYRRTWPMLATAGLAVSLFGLTALMSAAPGATASASVPKRAPATAAGATGYVGKPLISRSFEVYNLTGNSYSLTAATDIVCFISCSRLTGHSDSPPVGHVLAPGTFDQFGVDFIAAQTNKLLVSYKDSSSSAAATVTVTMSVDPLETNHIDVSGCPAGIRCVVSQAFPTNPVVLSLLDPPGTVHDIPAGQGQAQAQALSQLCLKNTAAVCDPKSLNRQEMVAGKPVVASAPWDNNSQDDAKKVFATEFTTEVSDSLGISYAAEFEVTVFGAKIKSTITASYKHEWSTSKTVTNSIEYTIRPKETGWVTAAPNYFRDWVDITITMGNTTWHLTNVYFDVPVTDPAFEAHYAIWTQPISGGPVTGPLTPSKVG